MKLKKTDDIYNEFVKHNPRRTKNSPVEEDGKDFLDMLDDSDSDITQNAEFMHLLLPAWNATM